MARIFISPDFIKGQEINLNDKKQIHYIIDVLRLKSEDTINIFDGHGNENIGIIRDIGPKEIVIEILKRNSPLKKPELEVTLIQALSKKNSFEFILEKATELGVNRIIPILTERSVPKIFEKSGTKLRRWQAIVAGAASQSGRADIPEILPLMSFEKSLKTSEGGELTLFACIDEKTQGLKEILKGKKPKKVALFIGPEGDFTKEEILKAKEAGYNLVSLGDNILKVETAAINLISIIRYEFS